MVILVTGASHTGKTLLAQRMLEVFGYLYLSIDHLKMGLIRSGNTTLTLEEDEGLTEYLWPIVREMVKSTVENTNGLIREFFPKGDGLLQGDRRRGAGGVREDQRQAQEGAGGSGRPTRSTWRCCTQLDNPPCLLET